MSSKNKKRIIAAAVFVLITAACIANLIINKNNNDKPDGDSSSNVQTDERVIWQGDGGKSEKKDKDTYVIGVSSAIAGIHPYKQNNDAMQVLLKLVYEPLAFSNSDGSVSYANASEITVAKNGKEAIAKLNTDKHFSDGKSLSADDVVWSYKWFMKEDTPYLQTVSRLVNVQKVDEQTVRFTFSSASINIMDVFALPVIHKSEDSENSTFLGTGEYKIKSIRPGSEVTAVPNEKSSQKAAYKQVLIKAMNYGDFDNILKNQEYDLFAVDKRELSEKVKQNGAYTVYENCRDTGYFLIYNNIDKSVRNGISKEIEKQKQDQRLMKSGVNSDSFVSPYMKDGYFSQLGGGGIEKDKEYSVKLGYDEMSTAIYGIIEAAITDGGSKCTAAKSMVESTDFKEDMLIYYGSFKDVIKGDSAKNFFAQNENMNVKDYYEKLEKYCADENLAVPVRRDTVWTAYAEGFDNLGIVF